MLQNLILQENSDQVAWYCPSHPWKLVPCPICLESAVPVHWVTFLPPAFFSVNFTQFLPNFYFLEGFVFDLSRFTLVRKRFREAHLRFLHIFIWITHLPSGVEASGLVWVARPVTPVWDGIAFPLIKRGMPLSQVHDKYLLNT